MQPRRLVSLVFGIIALALVDTACEKTETITLPGKTDTLIVQRPGKTDTIIVVRPDTVVINHAETTFVQLPGRVDTVIRVDTMIIPPRVDTVYVPKVDTVVVVHPETTYVTRPETLLVFVHDTIVQHDTVFHTDTVRLTQEPVAICITINHPDTLYALNWREYQLCDAAHLALHDSTHSVIVNVDTLYLQLPPPANPYRGTLLLPGYLNSHGPGFR